MTWSPKPYSYQIETCGSLLTIDLMASHDPHSLIQECFSYAQWFDQKYSRFIPGNWLDTVNTTPWIHVLDDESFSLLSFSLQLAELTDGAFDPTISPALEAHGYDRDYSRVAKPEGFAKTRGYEHVELGDHTVQLHEGVHLEFGAVGKGHVLDIIDGMLCYAGLEHFIINFGGDIIARGGYKIGLENPFNLEQLIGTIVVDGFAVAASNGAKRKFGDFHHLLDAVSGQPIRDIAGVFIAAPTGLLADAYSTAVFVSGEEKGVELLEHAEDITGMIVFSDGRFWKKGSYPGEVFA